MGGPQQLLPQLTQFQPADTPERLEAFVARLHAYPAFMAANTEILREGAASGLTAPRIVAERTIAQIERMLAVPIESAIVPSMAKVADEADRERIRDVVRDVVYPADAALPRGAPGRLPRRRPARSPGSGRRPNGERAVPDRDPQPGRRSTWTRTRSTRSASRSSRRSRPSAARSPGRRASATTPRRIAPRSVADPANHAGVQGRARRPGHGGHRAGDGRRAARTSGGCRRRAARSARSRSTRRRDAPFAYYYPPTPDGSRPGIYYANGYDLPSRTLHEARDRRPITRPPRATTSRSALEMENPHLNTFRRLGARMVGGAYVEGWGLYSERLADEMGLFRNEGERFGMLDAQAWRAGAARRRHRAPRPALAAPALDRLPGLGRAVRDRRA